MPQHDISDETAPREKRLFRSQKIRFLVIPAVVSLGIAAILAFPSVTHIRVGSIASSASSSAHSNGMEWGGATNGPNAAISQGFAVASTTASTTPAQRLIIESASFTIAVANVPTTVDKISKLVAKDNGFIQSMNQFTNQGQSATNMTIRMPVTVYATFLSALKSYGLTSDFSQTGEDVTEQHNDFQKHISQLQSETNAYTRLYNKAETMQDMLQIQQSLSQVNAEIANNQNQLHNLNRSIQLATITVNLTTNQTAGLTKRTTFFGSIKQSIQFMGHIGIITLSVIGWLLPWGIIAAIIGYGWRKWSQWRKSKSKHE